MIISLLNVKGGVGKTVSSINLGAALAAMGKTVLLVDVDLQGGVTSHFNLEPDLGLTTADVLAGAAGLDECIVNVRERFDLVPGTAQIEASERSLTGASGGEVRLRRAFKNANLNYDYVLIDCPSGWGPILRNAILASNAIIVPINSEPASITCAVSSIAEAHELADYHDHNFNFLGVLITRYRSTVTARTVESAAVEAWGEKIFETRIRQAEKINQLSLVGETTSDGKSGGVADDYAALALEIVERTTKQ